MGNYAVYSRQVKMSVKHYLLLINFCKCFPFVFHFLWVFHAPNKVGSGPEAENPHSRHASPSSFDARKNCSWVSWISIGKNNSILTLSDAYYPAVDTPRINGAQHPIWSSQAPFSPFVALNTSWYLIAMLMLLLLWDVQSFFSPTHPFSSLPSP